MDLLITFLIAIIYFLPLIIAIFYFAKIIFKFPSSFMMHLFLADICILIWGIAGIPVLLSETMVTYEELIIIEEIGVIFGSIAFILIFFIFNNPYYANKQPLFSRSGVITFSFIMGIKFALILQNNTNSSIYGLYILNGTLQRYTDPLISIIVLIAFLLLILVLTMFSLWQQRFPDYLIKKDIKKKSIYGTIMIAIGVAINYVGLIIPILNLSQILFLISRFFVAFGFIFITLMVIENPIIILKEKGNPYSLIDKGIVGWVLVSTTDHGPDPKVISDKTKKLYKITDKELVLFSVSSISIVGIGQNFTNTQFIIPFPEKEDKLSVLCYSFSMKDPTLKDPRKSNTTNIVFGIILPKVLVNFLGNILQESFSIAETAKNYETIMDLIKGMNFAEETFQTIRNLLLHKIT